MSTEKLAKLQSFSQGEVTFERLKQILATELSYSEYEELIVLSQYQLEQQKALARAINQIRGLLDIDAIFQTTTKEVCQLLEADRVAVYRFTPNWDGHFVAEFVTPGWVKLVEQEVTKLWVDTNLQETQGGRYRNNETFAVDDIYKMGFHSCHVELLEQFQAKAYIIAPIMIKDRLWGLLAAYQNSALRHWQTADAKVLAQIGEQFGIAVQQAELLADLQAEVSERQRIELSLRQAEHKYRDIFQNATEGIFQTTPDGRYLSANPALARIYGYVCPQELIANLTNIAHQLYVDPNRRSEFICLMQKDKLVSEFKSQVYRQDGRRIWISENARAVYDSKNILLYYEGFVEDITERKQAEEDIRNALEKEKELNELKSHFVTMTSHEFRTPLATILSSADLLQKYSHRLREEQKFTHLQQIQTTVKHMTQLLNDVLLIGKAEAGKLECNPAPLDLVGFCQVLVEDLRLINDRHTIALVNQGESTNACIDEKLLRHILSNLLSNAIKYSPQGGPIHFEVICQLEEVIFHIQDEGIGISAADQAQLFDSFYRASNVGTISGTGLGLAIVKKSVDLQGGKIAMHSEVGVGTTFTVTLPLGSKQVEIDD
jgi:PAS domain S-box-containing protein